jgi:hypothetical protein
MQPLQSLVVSAAWLFSLIIEDSPRALAHTTMRVLVKPAKSTSVYLGSMLADGFDAATKDESGPRHLPPAAPKAMDGQYTCSEGARRDQPKQTRPMVSVVGTKLTC